MAIPIPSSLIEFVLFGPLDDRRQLQDSPILGDVWIAFGQKPEGRQDLLIVPYRSAHPGEVAGFIEEELGAKGSEDATDQKLPLTLEELQKDISRKPGETSTASDDAEKGTSSDEDNRGGEPKLHDVAYIQGLVVARLTFFEMLSIVAPKTNWWISKWSQDDEPQPEAADIVPENKRRHGATEYLDTALEVIDRMLSQARAWNNKEDLKDFARNHPDKVKPFSPFERFMTLMGLILWAGLPEWQSDPNKNVQDQINNILNKIESAKVVQELKRLVDKMLEDYIEDPLVWQISLNRWALPALSKSVPAVKADAAKTLFNVDCSSIGWAVIDSGIDGGHRAFTKNGSSRVKESFDFQNFRRIVSLSNERPSERRQNLANLLGQRGLLLTKPIREAPKNIESAATDVEEAAAARQAAEQAEADAEKVRDTVPTSTAEIEAAIMAAKGKAGEATAKETAAIERLAKMKSDAADKEAKIIEQANEALKRLADDARKKGPIHWELVEMFVAIDPTTPPATDHGTHVAGIIGASKKDAEDVLKKATDAAIQKASDDAKKAAQYKAGNVPDEETMKANEAAASKAGEEAAAKEARTTEKKNKRIAADFVDGMCPDIALYDFRVLGPNIKETEFAIIAALQFIRHLNARDALFTIHGANLSLSIPHDVRNFACGRTPICDECERLVASGVVVVAAAGNHGYKSFQTADGSYDSYAAFSITDPGNAENILTVGATHRFWPHTYGVSFFSSRGPTGDGRLKPDLVAPGERIHSTFSNNQWGELDGTSMAAPHVSGAAAMLLARYSELIGQPMRVKRILCDSATDLGRERSFQGRGMLDVLRSFQSI
jgi:subtilisin family serine protease